MSTTELEVCICCLSSAFTNAVLIVYPVVIDIISFCLDCEQKHTLHNGCYLAFTRTVQQEYRINHHVENELQKSLSTQPGSTTIDVVLSRKLDALPLNLPTPRNVSTKAYTQARAIGAEAVSALRVQAEYLKQQQSQLEVLTGQLEVQQKTLQDQARTSLFCGLLY